MEGPSENPFLSQPLLGKLRRSMIPEKLRKRRVQAAENKVKAKHRSGVTPVFPVRLTSCIFTRPVTRITSHPGSKTMRRQEEEKLLKPRQLYESRRLQDYQVEDSKGEQLGPLDLTNSRRIPLGRWTQAVQSGANDLHTSRGFSSVQPPHSEQVRGTPVLPPPLSFYSQGETRPLFLRLSTFSQEQVTTADIRRQSWRVQKARKKLTAALEADRLARQAEIMGMEHS